MLKFGEKTNNKGILMIKAYGKWVCLCFVTLFPFSILADIVPFDDEITELKSDKGKDALYLHNAGAYLQGIEFEKGILEYGVLFLDKTGGSSGINWHIQENTGNFENFYIRPHNDVQEDANPTFKGTPSLPDNMFTSWELSKSFTHKNEIPLSHFKTDWKSSEIEANRVLNIAKYREWSGETKKLSFGYSNFATVYIEDRPLYSGSTLYRSRDYRYLGMLGVFDEVYLPLKEENNEVCIKVTDCFGGWATMGCSEDMSDITLK
jgi:hypothetical protein